MTSLAVSACTNTAEASWCDVAPSVVDAVDALQERAELPTPARLRDEVVRARDLIDAHAAAAPPDLLLDVQAIGAAITLYEDALDDVGFDLLAAQTQSDTDEQFGLYELETENTKAAAMRLSDHIKANCTP